MARPQIKRPLTKVAVAISAEAEEPVAALFERLFGQPASVYTDAQTQKTQANTYLDKLNPGDEKELASELAALKAAGLDIGSGKITISKVRQEDWAESWKKHFKPITIGRALLIKPSWSKRKPLSKQALVTIDPGLSFGTGQHATTSFCLRELVACRKAKLQQSFMDMGTGSGILAISAAKLGYNPVAAFDFDPEAVRIAKENATANGVDRSIHLSRKDLTRMPVNSSGRFDVICANLMYDLLIQEAERIANRLKPGGQLILAGILRTQFARVRQAYEERGFKLIQTKVEKEWQSGRFTNCI